MSQDDQFRAPAGWYPDPLGLPQLRWWNNHGWTEQVSAAPEPITVQEPRYAWKEDEPPVIPLQEAPAMFRPPAPPQTATASSLNELEAPRAANKIDEPSAYDDWQANFAPSAPAQASLQTPAPPAYWDEDDNSTPAPSVRPEDLKFWPGTNPAELRRQAREQAGQEHR